MKAILEFNLEEDRGEFEEAVNGWKWSLAMWELDQYLRTNTKYAPDSQPQEVYDALIAAREKLFEIMRESDLSFK
jgi:hypothetical protein